MTGSRRFWAVPLLMWCTAANAAGFNLGDFDFNFKSRLSSGVALRMEPQDPRLLGKLNVPGQQGLCLPDDCLSFSGDPAPNLRLVRAQGAYQGVNGDNGDLNYRQYGVTAATTKLTEDATLTWHDFTARVHGFGFVDPANMNFEETHTDTRFQPRETPRPAGIVGKYAKGGELLEAYLQYNFNIADRQGNISAGNEVVHWGESTFVQLNSLNEISPPNAAIVHMPGSEISEVFQAVPMVRLSTDLVDHVSAELLYQFEWKPVQPDPPGSFLASNDVAGGGHYAMIELGQYSEDPNKRYQPPQPTALVTSSTRTGYLLADGYGEPKGGGQAGLRINYFAEWLNGGTELDFYFLNYHSRLPYLSTLATDATCIPRGTTNVIPAFIACRGFKGTLSAGTGLEPLPIDTLKPFLDYPSNIHMYGFSFNTNAGKWSLAGEFSFRPNLPVQIEISDVVFAGLQPAFPDHDIPLLPLGNLLPPSALSSTIPGNRSAVPDFLSRYRHITIGPGQRIDGYERLQVGQLDFTGIRAIPNGNLLGADQIILITELGMTEIFNLPSRRDLQFEGGSLNETHASPGADGTGAGPGADPKTYTLHINPTQQTSGFATSFSWGLRLAARLEYDNLLLGWNLKPLVLVFQDLTGIGPSPEQNFVAGTTQIIAGSQVEFNRSLTGQLNYQIFTGGGRNNNLVDRDNLQLSLSYSF